MADTPISSWLYARQSVSSDNLAKKLTYHIGLVLGGGGAHGAYQIGVWQTLKEHQIHFEVITGTSVGALNGVLILQDDLSQALSLWQSLATNQVLQLPETALSEDLRKRFIQETRQMTRAAIIKGEPQSPL